MKLFATIVLALTLAACGPNYSEGEWTGTVVKLSKKGLIFESWEGMVNIGGLRRDFDGERMQTVANSYEFNVQSPTVVETIKKAMDSGQRVRLTYRQWAIAPPTISNDHVVIEATILDDRAP